jgi:1,4-dihydroxy-2-naphthoyl-CoA synthase
VAIRQGLHALTEDTQEGQKAFQEKRKPNWVVH